MATATERPVSTPPPLVGEQRILVGDVSWDFYVSFCEEISHSLVDRIGIFAALGVQELWRMDARQLRFCSLREDGKYQDRETSLAFPFLKPADLMPYLRLDDDTDETTRILRFRDWLRAHNKR